MRHLRFSAAAILSIGLALPAAAEDSSAGTNSLTPTSLYGMAGSFRQRVNMQKGTKSARVTSDDSSGNVLNAPEGTTGVSAPNFFAGAASTSFIQNAGCTAGRQFRNTLAYTSTNLIQWGGPTADVVELTAPAGLTFAVVAGSFDVSLTGSALVANGSPGTSLVFPGPPMTFPDSLFAFCEIWQSGAKFADCPVLKDGPILQKQGAGWGGFGQEQGAFAIRGRNTVALAAGSYQLRVGIAGEGSLSAPFMQLCSWMVSVDAN